MPVKDASYRWKQRNPGRVRSAKRSYKQRTKTQANQQRRMRWHNEPGFRDTYNTYRRGKVARLKQWLDEQKVASGCVDCGYSEDPCALDWDHVRGTKKRELSQCRSFAAAKREIAKCVVRCANCHRIKTYKDRQAAVQDKNAGPVDLSLWDTEAA